MDQIFVIGDIHGCASELDALLSSLPLAHGDTIAFVGDYIDRGPASTDVIRIVLDLQRDPGLRTVCLKGNHEDMFLDYMGLGGRHGGAFLYNGGAATLVSYGMEPWCEGPVVASRLPADHLSFFRALQTTYLTPPFLVVHAGVHPERALAEQREEDLLWIRDRFIAGPHALPYTVCFGHTPRRDVLIDLPYKIGLDTGCVYGNRLSCIELNQPRLFQVRAGQRRVLTRDLASAFHVPLAPRNA
jgi:serine/threonine protein phosphatase 1